MKFTSNKLTTAPAVEPVTVEELDTFLRGSGMLEGSDSTTLELLIIAAREYVERYLRKALITQTWTMYGDAFPFSGDGLGWWDGVREGSIVQGGQSSLELPINPLQSVTSIRTFDQDNSATVFDSSKYYLDTNREPGRVILNVGVTWPVFTRPTNGIEVVYVSGYGDTALDVPAPLRLAIRQLATHWYENREFTKTQSDMNQAVAPIHLQSILNRYRKVRL